MIHPPKDFIIEGGMGIMTSRYLWGNKYGPSIYYDSMHRSIRKTTDLGSTMYSTAKR